MIHVKFFENGKWYLEFFIIESGYADINYASSYEIECLHNCLYITLSFRFKYCSLLIILCVYNWCHKSIERNKKNYFENYFCVNDKQRFLLYKFLYPGFLVPTFYLNFFFFFDESLMKTHLLNGLNLT
jgi:hypothetical protein